MVSDDASLRPGKRGPIPEDVASRIEKKVSKGSDDECWPWAGTLNNYGYGQITIGSRADGSRRIVSAHRIVYEMAHGPIAEGLVIDHQCHNDDPSCDGGRSCAHRRCCNPAHL